MDNKLQELTKRLYEEGLAKGKEEGDLILANAREEGNAIRNAAREEAGRILEEARKEADEIKSKAERDIRMAAAQTLQSIRKDVENLVIASAVEGKVKETLSGTDFLKEMIRAVAAGFTSDGARELELVLPEKLKSGLEGFVKNELPEGVVSASFSKKIEGGFTIGPRDGGYFISMTDETFDNLISEHLRPVTRKILFG
ncbi:MAG: hypothetical protein MJY45_01980 [Bacteroidales bacterium]|nr:hypothetical protein [Bacteroidales bacterium]